ncbi:unnamed protein product [Rhizoctonia solani]|uniref:NACHT domain-containing protein n=1 Tax=Rhizoctonia solani TaxID=456999 RepID=A0A8H2XMF3_9AGAM|nr:unnamed protein product [Rhizoctonia solani]
MSTRLDRLSPSLSARYNSAQGLELKRGPCIGETRVRVLGQMYAWTCDFGQGSVYWLNGMAGTGKTTIAYTLSATLDGERRLAASLFCSRLLPECRKVSLIIPSIAYQLARFSRPFQSALSKVLERDPDAHTSTPDVQFNTMIVEPLRVVRETLPDNLVVIVDALDECDNKESTSKILDVLLGNTNDLPIKFILSSRPEPEIRDQMAQRHPEGSRLVLHELDKGEVQADIGIYLKTALAPINPSQIQISTLVERAGVLFIYAATVVRYVGYDNFRRNPRSRMESVLGTSSAPGDNKHKEIDGLYSLVLKAALDDPGLDKSDRDDMELVLHTVICVHEPLTVSALSELLQFYDVDRVHAALRPLWSVLHVVGKTERVATLHASFPDYMFASPRSKEYYCDLQVHNHTLTALCFDVIKKVRPQFNICELDTSYIRDNDVPDLEERVKKAISVSMFYSCKYWAAHLHETKRSAELDERLEDFLSVRLLLWLEVLSLKGAKNAAPEIMLQAQNWCMRYDCPTDTKRQIRDAWRFAATFASNPLSCSTPHIYISMLPFWPPSSPIFANYMRRTREMIQTEGSAMGLRRHTLLSQWRQETLINSISFSPDSTMLATEVNDGVYLLDAFSGKKKYILPPYGDWLLEQVDDSDPITFDADSWAARVRDDYRIKVARRLYLGLSDVSLLGIADLLVISPSGDSIASVRQTHIQDKSQIHDSSFTIHVSDRGGHAKYDGLKGHSGYITCLRFSHDSTHIASASHDQTIRIWDVANGTSTMRIDRPNEHSIITLIEFSPEGTRLASGSSDTTICIWDPRTGQLIVGPLQYNGYMTSICSICFSPDRKRIITCFTDGVMNARDVESGELTLGPLKISSTSASAGAIFSPDGSRIISWIRDYGGEICVWDAEVEDVSLDYNYLKTGVRWVKISPDGGRIVSLSDGGVLRVLNTQDGQIELEPFQEHHQITFTHPVFLRDGTRMICCSTPSLAYYWDFTDGRVEFSTHALPQRDSFKHSFGLSSGGAHLSSDGTRLFIFDDGCMTIWDTNDWQIASEFTISRECKFGDIESIKLSPDYRYVAVVENRRIYIYSAQTGKHLLGPFGEHHDSSWLGIEYSDDGGRIVSWTSYLCVWDGENAKMVLGPLTPPANGAHKGGVTVAKFSVDGTRIVCALVNAILVWDARSGQLLLGPLDNRMRFSRLFDFSLDGTRIVCAGEGIIRVRDISIPDETTESPDAPSPFTDWKVKEDGWVVDAHSNLLVWVPPDLQGLLMEPRTTLLISDKGHLRLNFDGARIGEAWTGCYVSDSEI